MKKHRDGIRWMLYTGAIAAAMMVAVYIALGIWPFGDATVLTGDLNGQYINYFAHFKRAFFGQAGFTYGFDKALGGSLLGLFAYYVSSPANLLYLLVPTAYSPVVASFLLAAKVVAACVLFEFYAEKKYPGLGWLGVSLGLCYGFLAYAFSYAQNIMWHDVVLLLPLVCYGVDRILAGKGIGVYTLALALAIFANFYIAYMACIFLVLYFVYSLLLEKRELRQWKKPVLKFAGGSLLAGGLTMGLLLPALANVSGSKGGLLSYHFSFDKNFSLLRLPERMLWGGFVWQDVENGLPQIYCGLLVLLLVLSYFFSRKTPLREKIITGGLLGILVLSFWIRGLDILWHGLKPAVWFPYRNSYIFCFFMVLVAARALATKAVSLGSLAASLGAIATVVAGVLVFPGSFGRKKPLLSLAAILLLAALLYLLKLAKTKWAPEKLLALALTGVVAVELAASGFYITSQFEKYSLSDFSRFVNDAGGTAALLEGQTPRPARLEKNFTRSLNDPMLLDYNGVSHFGSTQDDSVVDVLASLGYRNYSSNTYYYGSTVFADGVLGISRFFADDSRPVPAHWKKTELGAAYETFENPFAAPLLFEAKGMPLPAEDLGTVEDSFAYQNRLYRQITGREEDLLLPADYRAQDGQGQEIAATGAMPPNFRYRVQAKEEGFYYALPVAQDGAFYGLGMLIDGQPAGSYFSADNYGVINLGRLEAGESVELGWNSDQEIGISKVWFCYIPTGKMREFAEFTWQNPGDFEWKDGQVQGQITCGSQEPVLFTAIPYEKGWTARVNGKDTEVLTMGGGLIALKLEKGHNQVELRYQPAMMAQGWVVSALSLAAFVVWLALDAKRKKQR